MPYLLQTIRLHTTLKYTGMFPAVISLQEAIKLVLGFHIRSEVIGGWLYCFTNPFIGFQLEEIGFWYSYKHRAYVYTGTPQRRPRRRRNPGRNQSQTRQL